MNHPRVLLLAAGVVISAQTAAAQDMSRYRDYALDSSLASVTDASGARAADVKTLHQRPAAIQELLWRVPYSGRGATADPVREIAFTFYNDALYQVVVDYDRSRTDGLTNADIVEVLSVAYGKPLLAAANPRRRPTAAASYNDVVVAQWESAESLVTLLRDSSAGEFQLILVSKPLSDRARIAIREAVRLDALDAPRLESAQRIKDADAARADNARTRSANKAAFRP